MAALRLTPEGPLIACCGETHTHERTRAHAHTHKASDLKQTLIVNGPHWSLKTLLTCLWDGSPAKRQLDPSLHLQN